MTIAIKIHMDNGCEDLFPRKAHDDDAAFDLRSRIDTVIPSGKIMLVPTGVFMELPVGYEAQVRPRSGLALKHGITVLNTPGTIDAGYRGEVGVILVNLGDKPFVVEEGMKVAQIVVARVEQVEIEEVRETDATALGAGEVLVGAFAYTNVPATPGAEVDIETIHDRAGNVLILRAVYDGENWTTIVERENQ